MDRVTNLSIDQRRDLFTQTAARMNLPPGLIEKDFWVCWILKLLFSMPDIESNILFKGGTTLSKIFGIIERFSEDIDLVLDYEMLGFYGDRSPIRELSSKQLKKLLSEMQRSCERYIATTFLDTLKIEYLNTSRIHNRGSCQSTQTIDRSSISIIQ